MLGPKYPLTPRPRHPGPSRPGHTGHLSVPQTCQVPSHLRALAPTFPSAWKTAPPALHPVVNLSHPGVRAHIGLLPRGTFPAHSAQSPPLSPPSTPVSTPPLPPCLPGPFHPSPPHSLFLGSNQDSNFASSCYFSVAS